ncbi:MAG: hypothetical protein K2Z81_26790, partial [Cyanobacteria bacterium]|nr:hypothetical protein [Cyanobacteriota bacterium]
MPTERQPGDLQRAKTELRRYIFQLLLMLTSSMVVVACVSLLSDINWARPQLELRLSSELARKVSLGRLTWCLGLNGLQIETSKFRVDELSGAPFISARRSEIGLSAIALLANKVVVNHVEFEQPILRLVKTGPDQWNFDDLIRPGPEIRLIQLENGQIQLVDESKSQPTDAASEPDQIDLNAVNIKFNWPRKKRKLPFYAEMEIADQAHPTKVKLSGYSTGAVDSWKKDNYSFQLQVDGVKTSKLERIKSILLAKKETTKSENDREAKEVKETQAKPPVVGKSTLERQFGDMNGLFDFQLSGDGCIADGIKAKIDITANDVSVANDTFGKINAGNSKGSLALELNDRSIAWKDLNLAFHGVEIKSGGTLTAWQGDDAKISAHVQGSLIDLKKLDGLVERIGSKRKNDTRGSFITDINPAHLSGSAIVDIDITGTPMNADFQTKISTNNLMVSDLLKDAGERLPILRLAGITSESKVTGDVRLSNNNRVELTNGFMTGQIGTIKAKGFADLSGENARLEFEARNLPLSNMAIEMGNNRKVYQDMGGSAKLFNTNFKMNGFVDAQGLLQLQGATRSLSTELTLDNSGFALTDKSLTLDNVRGKVKLSTVNGGGDLNLSNVTGTMGGGEFQLNGDIKLRHASELNLEFHATSFNLRHLASFLNLMQIKIPVLTEQQLYGKVRDVRLKITGLAHKPKIYFSAIPDDLYYQPPGLDTPLRARSGHIVFDHDELVLTEVTMVMHSNEIQTSLTIEDVSTRCLLKRVRAKSEGIELTDINYYLSSPAMPPPLRKAYTEVL